MNSELRHRRVAVAVIHDESKQRFLLWHNPRWHGYAFPMKKIDVDSGQTADQAALAACSEWNVPLPVTEPVTVDPIGQMGDFHYSEGVRQYTFYDYHLIRVVLPEVDESSLHPDLKYFTFEELENAPNVTYSTKKIAAGLVGDRHVVAAVVSRVSARGREFLLTYTPGHQYFFPSSRLRHAPYPAEEVIRVVNTDLGYEGAIDVVEQIQVDALQESDRFGRSQTRFHFHLCLLNVRGADLTDGGNALEQSVADVASSISTKSPEVTEPAYCAWFTEEEMRTRKDMSLSMASVLNAALQLQERNQ